MSESACAVWHPAGWWIPTVLPGKPEPRCACYFDKDSPVSRCGASSWMAPDRVVGGPRYERCRTCVATGADPGEHPPKILSPRDGRDSQERLIEIVVRYMTRAEVRDLAFACVRHVGALSPVTIRTAHSLWKRRLVEPTSPGSTLLRWRPTDLGLAVYDHLVKAGHPLCQARKDLDR